MALKLRWNPHSSDPAAATQAAVAQAAVAAIMQALPAARQCVSQQGKGADVMSAFLEEVISKSVGQLQGPQQPCAAPPPLAQTPPSPLPGGALIPPPPGLRTELRSSAAPFVSGRPLAEKKLAAAEAAGEPKLSGGGPTLRTHLQHIEQKDHQQVLIVRGIQRLGLESPAHLQAYFECFGPVESVLVSHSCVRDIRRPAGRVRPAHLGFVVMQAVGPAQRALAAGKLHRVGGVRFEVTPFVHNSIPRAVDSDETDQL